MHFVQHGLGIYILPTMAPVDYFSCQYLHRHWHRHWHRHHIRPSHFSMLPPFAICPFAFSSFFNPDNGNCCILQCHGWPKPCHSSIAGDCKKSPANQDSSQITSDNIGRILILKDICTSWVKTNCAHADVCLDILSIKGFHCFIVFEDIFKNRNL